MLIMELFKFRIMKNPFNRWARLEKNFSDKSNVVLVYERIVSLGFNYSLVKKSWQPSLLSE